MDALRRLVAALRGSSRVAVRDVGITTAQLFVLRQLAREPDQSINRLAELTCTRQNTVSDVVARLVERRLVRRETAADDARRVVVSLTPAGRALARRAPLTIQGELVLAFRRLTPAQRRALADSLEAWIASAGLAGLSSPFFFEPPGRNEAPRHRRSARGSGVRTKPGRTAT